MIKNTLFGFLSMVMLGSCAISIMAAQNDFSGTWVLDKQKSHGLPKNLKSYTLVVTQNEQQLVVESKLESGRVSESSGHVVGVVNLSKRQQVGSAGGTKDAIAPGSLAIATVMPQVIYSLDGKVKSVPSAGAANIKLKAKWAKDGKTLDLSAVQDNDMKTQTAGVTIKERWTLSDDGAVLKIQRSVGAAEGSDAITLIFGKGASGAPTPQQ